MRLIVSTGYSNQAVTPTAQGIASMSVMDIEAIKRMLPHRYPFLMIDRVLELEDGKRCVALKNVTGNEEYFEGHFPGNPVMPGVLIVEAMAQACGIAAFGLTKDAEDQWLLFAGIEKARFKKTVVPGDQLILDAEYKAHKLNVWVFHVKATVEGKRVAQAEIRIVTVPKSS